MRPVPRAVLFALCVLALCAGCGGEYDASELPEALRINFRGPGTLAVVWNLAGPDDVPDHRLAVYARSGARMLGVEHPIEVRWLAPDALLVSRELRADAIDELPRAQLSAVDPSDGTSIDLGEPGRYFGAEPSPDGHLLAVAAELDERGESRLELRDLEASAGLLVATATSFDEPRWSPDGRALVAAKMVQAADPDEVSIGGVSVPSPRLYRLRRDLFGSARPLPDGPPGGGLAPRGSLPLYWSADGIVARQREGLVLCDPEGGGCLLVGPSPEGRRIVEARPFGAGARALVLLVDTGDASLHPLPIEVGVVDLQTQETVVIAHVTGAHPVDLDWTGD